MTIRANVPKAIIKEYLVDLFFYQLSYFWLAYLHSNSHISEIKIHHDVKPEHVGRLEIVLVENPIGDINFSFHGQQN